MLTSSHCVEDIITLQPSNAASPTTTTNAIQHKANLQLVIWTHYNTNHSTLTFPTPSFWPLLLTPNTVAPETSKTQPATTHHPSPTMKFAENRPPHKHSTSLAKQPPKTNQLPLPRTPQVAWSYLVQTENSRPAIATEKKRQRKDKGRLAPETNEAVPWRIVRDRGFREKNLGFQRSFWWIFFIPVCHYECALPIEFLYPQMCWSEWCVCGLRRIHTFDSLSLSLSLLSLSRSISPATWALGLGLRWHLCEFTPQVSFAYDACWYILYTKCLYICLLIYFIFFFIFTFTSSTVGCSGVLEAC